MQFAVQFLDPTGKLVLETQGQLLNQFFSRFAKVHMAVQGSVVDELIAERRAEAVREDIGG